MEFEVAFFLWLRDQILMIKDFSYAGTDFRGDLDLPLPPGAQWGDIGKKKIPKMVIMFLCFLCVVTRPNVYMQMLVVHDPEDLLLWIDDMGIYSFIGVMITLLSWRSVTT